MFIVSYSFSILARASNPALMAPAVTSWNLVSSSLREIPPVFDCQGIFQFRPKNFHKTCLGDLFFSESLKIQTFRTILVQYLPFFKTYNTLWLPGYLKILGFSLIFALLAVFKDLSLFNIYKKNNGKIIEFF